MCVCVCVCVWHKLLLRRLAGCGEGCEIVDGATGDGKQTGDVVGADGMIFLMLGQG